ncbi:DUF5688 family protein [Candidatus Ventrimonas sp. KK005]
MLSFKDFTNEVLEKLKERLGYKYDFQVTEVEKNNNVKKIAIVAGMYEESSSIVIYIEGYYEEYINGVCIEQIVYSMSAFIQSNHIEIDVEEIKDYEQIKDRLFFRLINYKENKASLRNVPHIRYFDLSIVFCLSFKGDGYMTVTINNNLMETWEKSVEELYEQTKKNTPILFEKSFKSINEVLLGLVKERLGDNQNELDKMEKLLAEQEIISLYVLTNKIGINGAAVILYDNVLKMIAEELESDLIILPSSIHEVLVLVYWREGDIIKLKEMVHDINRNEVPMTDILSDNVYRYSREDDKVYMITED